MTLQPRKPRSILALLITGLLVLPFFSPVFTVLGFMPDAKSAAVLGGAGSRTHAGITYVAIKEIDTELFPELMVNGLTGSMEEAVSEIQDAAISVDNPKGPEFTQATAHFDGETFVGSQNRLVTFKQNAIDALNKGDARAARVWVGRALHTLQDFYSHSNWIELGNTTPYVKLGDPNIPGASLSTVTKTTATCTDCTRAFCNECVDNLTTQLLTTGYYKGDDVESPGQHKCNHGGFFDKGSKGMWGDGINKDTLQCRLTPHTDLHLTAAGVAQAATKNYVKQITDAVGIAKAKLLLGVGPVFAIAIDTSGSMGFIYNQVKQQVTQMVDARVNSNEKPHLYVLVAFNDPGFPAATVTSDPAVFKTALNGLTIGGGDDCPELAMGGMLEALKHMGTGGSLFVFTDADAKDSYYVSNVITQAKSNKVKIYPFVFGGCGESGFIDPNYFRIARESGGQVFKLADAEAGAITGLIDPLTRSNQVNVLSIQDTLTGTYQNLVVPIDSTMTQATFSVSGTNAVSLIRPDDFPVQANDPDTEMVTVETGTFITIDNPVPGQWRLEFSGSGEFTAKVTGESSLRFNSFDYLEAVDGAHPGLFPVNGSPLSGEVSKVSAEISLVGSGTPQIQLRSPQGAFIQNLTLQDYTEPGDAFKLFYGEVSLPATPFLVYATGTDSMGKPYQRLRPGVVEPQGVKVTPPAAKDLRPGKPAEFTFQVKNLGPTDTFLLSANNDKNYPSSVSEIALPLQTNATKYVTVILNPPADAAPGELVSITLSAESTRPSGAKNAATINTSIVESTIELGAVTATAGSTHDTVNVELTNEGGESASNIVSKLTTSTPGITIISDESAYADLAPAQGGTNITPFTFVDSETNGRPVNFTLSVMSEGYDTARLLDFTVQTRPTVPPATNSCQSQYAGVPVPIPDHDPAGVSIPVFVSGMTGGIQDLNFKIDGSTCTTVAGAPTVGIDHTCVGDVVVKLTSPQGTVVTLINQIDGNCHNNFCNTLLDDEGGGYSIQDIFHNDAPFTGTFTPANPLAIFKGEDPNGMWTLNVSDRVAADVGNVRAFSLLFSVPQCQATPTPTPTPTPKVSGRIAFSSDRGGNSEIYTINADASGLSNITNNPDDESQPLWSPDGTKLLFISDRSGDGEIYRMDANGANVIQLTDSEGFDFSPVWSPDSTRLLFESVRNGSLGIYIINADGSNLTQLQTNQFSSSSPAWSPDGNRISYVGDGEVYVINTDGTGQTRLTYNTSNDRYPRWSPDGSRIAFVNQSLNDEGIYVMNQDGSNQRRLTRNIAGFENQPLWSPDSAKIAFTRQENNDLSIYLMNADGNNLARLTNSQANQYEPTWSPDGAKLLFTQYVTDEPSDIFVINADGSGLVQLTSDPDYDYEGNWQPLAVGTLAPDLSITKQHTGAFTAGADGHYTLTVNNVGTAQTAGTITVTDTLPAGLSFASATGTGWSCSVSGQTVSCTTGNSLSVGTSTAIDLTVHVSDAGYPSVTNTASVSGGGDSNTANNTGSVSTNVSLAPVTISGNVTNGATPLGGVNITLSGSQSATTVTDTNGSYSFVNLPGGGSYILTPSLPGYAFAPASRSFADLRVNQSANFSGFVPTTVTSGNLLISEFRFRGPTPPAQSGMLDGAADEFVELYNNTAAPITVGALDGSAGWALVASDGVVRFIVPNGTVIPALGHFLGVHSSGYSLNTYATGNATYSNAIDDNAGIAIFKTAEPANFTSENRLDSVGFDGVAGTLYREGVGLAQIGSTDGEYSFVRKLLSGPPQDTEDNVADFAFVSTTGALFGSNQSILGAPGPENLSSSIQRNATIKGALVDPLCSGGGAQTSGCARVRIGTPVPNGAYGTLAIRRKFTNKTGGNVTKLRFRVVDITTLNTPGYVAGGTQADLRVVPSAFTNLYVTLADGSEVLLKGTQVESSPAQPGGGGFHSSLVTITTATPLISNASVNVEFTLGVQQNGSFRFAVNVEALP